MSGETKPETLVRYGKVIVLNDSDDEIIAQTRTADDLLNSLLPPLQFVNEHNEKCVQFVLSAPAGVVDVFELQNSLDNELQRHRARETGLCPIRERLYAQCFDEIIRQVVIGCSQRGVLLVRLRDEMRATIEAYKQLYASCIAFGVRAAIDGVDQHQRLEAEAKQLIAEEGALQGAVQALEAELSRLSIAGEDLREGNEHMTRLRAENEELRTQIRDAFVLM